MILILYVTGLNGLEVWPLLLNIFLSQKICDIYRHESNKKVGSKKNQDMKIDHENISYQGSYEFVVICDLFLCIF